ncbi:type VII secretion-associated serine protease mycosin [Micromonospora parva]|uniref:type VII secretion-associated serine protease mycosin n=1 Tax=Micromonospora parva TaxID=1464048 RepID=UPI0009DE7EAD|nr:type VII secretion-associated serine protease mycosin [Micromonospora parva]
MRVNVGSLRPVVACLLAGFLVAGVAQPAAAAPRRAEQWYLDELRIDQVHKVSTGRGVVVAVLDSGVEASHPDLRGQVLAGGRSYGAAGDGRADEDGHGTHIAGIIAAKGGSDGVDGIAPGAKVLPIKLRKGTGSNSEAAVALGIRMAVDGGAKVINMSFGGPGMASPQEASAIKYALDHDVVVVGSAGNTANGRNTVSSPANTPGVIAVTGTTKGGKFWSGSVRGPEAVVAAPGDSVYNITNEAGYGWGDGTSDSSAIVSGLAALIRAKYPDLSAPSVINRIIRTARDAGPSGRDPQYGFGVIDPMKALTANVPPVTSNPLLGPAAATDPDPAGTGGPARTGGADEEFDVTQHGDRGGPTDQQVMVVGIGIAVVLVLLLGLAVFLIWNRRRYRREAARAAQIPDEVLDRVTPGAPPSPDAYYAPSPGYAPPPGYPPPPGHGQPSGYAPPPGYGPPSGYGPPGGPPPVPPTER